MSEDIPSFLLLLLIMHSALFSKASPGPSQYGLDLFEVLRLHETRVVQPILYVIVYIIVLCRRSGG